MDVYDAVRTVLAVRSYLDKPVPAESVNRIVNAGRLTASSMNGQPWQFIVVDDRETLQKLGSLARTGPYITKAPLAIVVLIENTVFAVSDASRAIQSMVLTAWSEGLGSNWVGFKGLDEAGKYLGVPANLEILAIIPIGYPDKSIGKGIKKRKSLYEVAHKGKFGKAFS